MSAKTIFILLCSLFLICKAFWATGVSFLPVWSSSRKSFCKIFAEVMQKGFKSIPVLPLPHLKQVFANEIAYLLPSIWNLKITFPTKDLASLLYYWNTSFDILTISISEQRMLQLIQKADRYKKPNLFPLSCWQLQSLPHQGKPVCFCHILHGPFHMRQFITVLNVPITFP